MKKDDITPDEVRRIAWRFLTVPSIYERMTEEFDSETFAAFQPRLAKKLSVLAEVARPTRKTLRRGSSIKRERVKYLWKPYVPIGLTAVAGESDSGKSWVWAKLTAAVTTGGKMMGSKGREISIPASDVILIQRENDEGSVIIPRLQDLGGDVERLVLPEEPFSFRDDDDLESYYRLAWYLEVSEAKLVFIDPIQGYVNPARGAADQNGIRIILERLQAVARYYGVAIVYVNHLNKNSELAVLKRVMNSVEFVNVPRSVLVTQKDPDGTQGDLHTDLMIFHEQTNLPDKGVPLAYTVTGKEKDLTFDWRATDADQTSDQVSNALYDMSKDDQRGSGTKTVRVRDAVLMYQLAAEEPIPAATMKALVQGSLDFDVTASTWQRAMKDWPLNTVQVEPGLYVFRPVRQLDATGSVIDAAAGAVLKGNISE